MQPDDAIASRSGLSQRGNLPHFLNVAPRAGNAFDRYHAEPFPSAAEAAEYLAAFVANSVHGFSDMVNLLAPDSAEPNAFLTGMFDYRHEKACGTKIARIPLTAHRSCA